MNSLPDLNEALAPEVGVCASCHQPLTHCGAAGECLRCLVGLIFSADDNSPGKAPSALRYGHFEIATGLDGLPVELGTGAMATTYEAYDTVLQSTVALKVISAQVSQLPEARARFLREARAAAKLHHPNIASVSHYGEHEGECYYAMELVDGETLDARVRREGPLPAALVLEIAVQVARALVAAEACGVVHRDLKPSNLMVTSRQAEAGGADSITVKVIDWGLAKAVTAELILEGDQTRGGFIGTPSFASPEQFSYKMNDRIDTRSDIYSLGITMWYLLCAQVPFVGHTLAEVEHKQRTQELPWEQLKGVSVSKSLRALLRSMLASDPARRPQSARELLEFIRRVQGKSILHFQRRVIWTVAGMLVLALLAASSVWWRELHPGMLLSKQSVAVLPFENLSPDKAEAFYAGGIQSDIASSLAHVAGLKVMSPESTQGYRSGEKDVAKISRDLNVTHLLEGSVRREGDHVSIVIDLIDPQNRMKDWQKTYEGKLSDVFAIQSDITRELSRHLHVTVSPQEKAVIAEAPTTDPVAYDLYLRATEEPHLFRGPDDFRAGMNNRLSLLEQAVRRDPRFVLAYCAMAGMHDAFYRVRAMIPEERGVDHRSMADVELEKARLLKPDDGDVHLALAHHLYSVSGDSEQARIELDLARRTLPNNADLEQNAGMIAADQGRWTDAVRAYERSIALEPREMLNYKMLSEVYRCTRDYAAADRALSRFFTLQPSNGMTFHHLFRATLPLEARADLTPLRAALAQSIPSADNADADPYRLLLGLCARDPGAITRTLARSGAKEYPGNGFIYPKAWFAALAARMRGDKSGAQVSFTAARAELDKQLQANPLSSHALSLLAVVDAGLGRKEEAVQEAQRACVLMPPQKSAEVAPAVACNLAIVYAWTNQVDKSFALLDQLSKGNAGMNILYQPSYGDLVLDPLWDPLRQDLRFAALIRRLAPKRPH